MDAKHSADMFKHLEKQSEVLMESYRAMSHELHGLQVEEEMLMHKLYELMFAEGLIKKEEASKDSCQVHEEKDNDQCQVDAHKEKEKDSDGEYTLPHEDTSSSEEEYILPHEDASSSED